jgi:hypothetical protein
MGEFCETTIVPKTDAIGLSRFSDQANPPKRPASRQQGRPAARLGFLSAYAASY